jgi:hypothetical protein
VEPDVAAVDPFELPEWLGTGDVTWTAHSSVRGARLIRGSLSGGDGELACDLLAADVAHPEPLVPEPWRRQAHQVLEHGQVLLVERSGRLTLAVPGTAYSADGVLETLGRLARAVGVDPHRFAAHLRL